MLNFLRDHVITKGQVWRSLVYCLSSLRRFCIDLCLPLGYISIVSCESFVIGSISLR